MPPAGNLAPGTIVDERYRIESFLGRGGMCSVYKAEHLQLLKPVALKFLAPWLAKDPGAVERFRHETIAVSTLSHANIIDVFGFGVFHNRPYMALEFLEGSSLATVLSRQPENRLSEERALPIFMQICDALIHAHSKGIIHRDLKPSNVMLVGDEQSVRLVDFGVAKILPQSGKELQKLTQTGQILGSAPYMSPEQCLCMPLDPRSDIYSLGCLMHETIAGTPPFIASNAYATIAQQVGTLPQRREALDTPVGNVILSCLEKNRDRRPQSVQELKDALQHPPRNAPSRRFTGSWIILLVAGITVALLAAVLAWQTWLSVREHEREVSSQRKDQIKIADNLLDQAVNEANRRTTGVPASSARNFYTITDLYKKALNTAVSQQDREAIAESQAKLARALIASKQITGLSSADYDRQAIKLCQQVLQAQPARAQPSAASLMALETLGDAYMNERDYASAQPYVDDYANVCPRDARAWALVRQGSVYMGLRSWSAACRKFNDAIRESDYVRNVYATPQILKRDLKTLTGARLGLGWSYIMISAGKKQTKEYQQGVNLLRDISNVTSLDDSTVYAHTQQAKKLLSTLHESPAPETAGSP